MQYSNSNIFSGSRSERDYYYVGLTPANYPGDYVKYRWPDGGIHFNCISGTYKEIRYVGSKIGAQHKCNTEGKELAAAANRCREKIRPYLYGNQEYVVLNPNSLNNKIYILFKDGTLFSEFGSKEDPIFSDNTKLETFLINAVKTINNKSL